MTFFQWVQTVGSTFGAVSFVALIVAVFLHEKLKDYFAAIVTQRQHSSTMIVESHKADEAVKGEIIKILFTRRITAHDTLRTELNKLFLSLAMVSITVEAYLESSAPSDEATASKMKLEAANTLNNFDALVHVLAGDLGKETITACEELFEEGINLSTRRNYEKMEMQKFYKCTNLVRKSLDDELRSIYQSGFRKLLGDAT